MKYNALHLEDGENVILEVRRHWIVFVANGLLMLFMGVVPFLGFVILEYFLPQALGFTFSGSHFWFFTYAYSLWLLLLWISFFSQWTKYYLDVWYVTERRIIIIDQKRLFHREVFNVRFDRIQDVSIEVNGIISTFLGFGNVRVQTASEDSADLYLSTVRRPDEVKKVIFRLHNIIGEAHSHSNTQPPHSHF